MRCTSCHTYIPEGLAEPTRCPQCGRDVGIIATTSTAPTPSTPPSPASLNVEAFAPYFTVLTHLSFAPATEALPDPSYGSVSFGPEGFSIVWQKGRQWEKVPYRELSTVRLEQAGVTFDLRNIECRIAFFSSWTKKPSAQRALAFKQLLENVQHGLSDAQIKDYQRRLR